MGDDSRRSNGTAQCPACGAAIPDDAGSCGECSWPLPPEHEPHPGPPVGDRPGTERSAEPSRPGPSLQFSLASLLLMVTLIAVVLGGYAHSPCIGIALAILAAPAVLYTAIAARRRQRRGKPMSAAEKVVVFGDGVGKSVAVLVLLLFAISLILWLLFVAWLEML
jgi:hypothetical protein